MLRNFFYFFLSIFLLSCISKHHLANLLMMTVTKQNYNHVLEATGIIEATKTYSITTPGVDTDATIIYLIPEGSFVEKGDTVCVLEAAEIENNYKEAVRQNSIAHAEYEKTVADLNLQYLLLESNVKTIEARTAITQLDSTKLQFVSPYRQKIITLTIQRAEIEKQKNLDKLAFLEKINDSELKRMKLKIAQTENRMIREKEKLDRLILTTDVSGTVLYEKLWTTGEKPKEGNIVWSIMPLISIPDMSEFQVKLIVNDTKFKRIQKGQTVRIRIDAFPEIMLNGEILKKVPMGKPIKRGSQIKMFEIYASIDSSGFSIKPGLSVTCDVIVEAIEDTLVVPLYAIFVQDSLKMVYRKDGNCYLEQPVEISVDNGNHAVISAGLYEGEQIALSRPPDKFIKSIGKVQ